MKKRCRFFVEIMIEGERRKELGELKKNLENVLDPLAFKMVLFGSRARGDGSEDSDMDILVVLESPGADAERYVSECAWEAGIGDGVVVTPITYSAQEWSSGLAQHSLLAAAIREEGIDV